MGGGRREECSGVEEGRKKDEKDGTICEPSSIYLNGQEKRKWVEDGKRSSDVHLYLFPIVIHSHYHSLRSSPSSFHLSLIIHIFFRPPLLQPSPFPAFLFFCIPFFPFHCPLSPYLPPLFLPSFTASSLSPLIQSIPSLSFLPYSILPSMYLPFTQYFLPFTVFLSFLSLPGLSLPFFLFLHFSSLLFSLFYPFPPFLPFPFPHFSPLSLLSSSSSLSPCFIFSASLLSSSSLLFFSSLFFHLLCVSSLHLSFSLFSSSTPLPSPSHPPNISLLHILFPISPFFFPLSLFLTTFRFFPPPSTILILLLSFLLFSFSSSSVSPPPGS